MALQFSLAQVQALAPDSSSVAAGKKLGTRAPWKTLGQTEQALWGECQGSALYQTQVALVDLASKCTCPSRKFPCKHALGLLFLAAGAPDAFPVASAPEWVADWLEKRGAAQQKKQARAEAVATKPVDEVAQAKRAEKRHDNILAGLDQLDAWMGDLLRQGLARAQAQPPSFWDMQSRRLVDAQAPGLASRVRQIGWRIGASGDWTSRVLDDLGALGLLSHAFRRLDQLGAALAADVRRIVGITLDQTDVIAHGETVEDEWLVAADVIEEDERVRTQRAWLKGAASGRTALVLQFTAGTGRFAEALATGTRFRAKIAYWPSASPQRALVASRSGQAESTSSPPQGDDVAGSIDRFSGRLAELPWLDRELFVLRNVVAEPGDVPHVIDEGGSSLPLHAGDHDRLFALGGGHPVTLAAEWNGYALTPLTVWADGRVVSVGRRAP